MTHKVATQREMDDDDAARYVNLLPSLVHLVGFFLDYIICESVSSRFILPCYCFSQTNLNCGVELTVYSVQVLIVKLAIFSVRLLGPRTGRLKLQPVLRRES